MDKPERPGDIAESRSLIDRGGSAFRGARDAASRAWEKATASPTEEGHRRKVLFVFAAGIVAVIAALFVLSRLGGEETAHTPISTAQAVSVVTVQTNTIAPRVALNGE